MRLLIDIAKTHFEIKNPRWNRWDTLLVLGPCITYYALMIVMTFLGCKGFKTIFIALTVHWSLVFAAMGCIASVTPVLRNVFVGKLPDKVFGIGMFLLIEVLSVVANGAFIASFCDS